MTGLCTICTPAASNDIRGARVKPPGVVIAKDGRTLNEHELASPTALERRQDAWSLVCCPHIAEALTERTADEALARAQYYCMIASFGGYVGVFRAIPRPSAVSAHVLPAAPDRRRVGVQETSQGVESTAHYYPFFETDVGVVAVVILDSVEYRSTFVSSGLRHTSPSGDFPGLIELASNRVRAGSHQAQHDRALSGWHYRTLVRGTQQAAWRLQSPPSRYHPKLARVLRDNCNPASPYGRSRGSMRLSTDLVAVSLCTVSLSRTSKRFGQPEVGAFTAFAPLLLPTVPAVGDTSRNSTVQRSKKEHDSNSDISISLQAESLQRKVRDQIQSLGLYKPSDGACEAYTDDKERVRNLHGPQRLERLSANAEFLSRRSPNLLHHFASGQEIDAAEIQPQLERVYAGTWQGDLFRLAALTWSVPVSNGFGRRLRYLVWDMHNKKLLGLIAIGDPVFNLSVRDTLIGWDAADRRDRLVNVMDAYVLGAMPPYNMLLAGKMVACLVRSRQIYDDFTCAYGGTVGIISGKAKQPRLLSVTTSSSMGRSSVYNRLKLGGVQYLQPIGYTRGWGHFHISEDLFLELRDYLRSIGHQYADQHRFGQGPNWRLRTTRAALKALGFREDLLRHGIRRQVFMCNLASNAANILRTGKGRPDLSALLTVQQVADLALERWILPRARRRPDYRVWNRSDVLRLLGDPVQLSHVGSKWLNPTLAI